MESFQGEEVEDSPCRTHSSRKARKTNALNVMFGSKYRHPDNRTTLLGREQTLGKASTIMAVMMHGPDLPTELSQHNERHRIFMAAAQYALSKSDTSIGFILASPDREEKVIYYHNLLTTSCWPISALLYNDGREFFQRRGLMSVKHNAEYKLHLGLDATHTVFDK